MVEAVDFSRFRRAVDQVEEIRDEVLIKLLYLSAARVSEVTTKVVSYDLAHDLTRPYGQRLDFLISEFKDEKVLLLKMAVAKKGLGEDTPCYRIAALPVHPQYEPWTIDLLKWIRDFRQLRFDLIRNRVYTIVRHRLRGLDPGVTPRRLRQWRFSHLVAEYGFSPSELAAYDGRAFSTGFS